MAQAPLLTVILHGSFSACRKDGEEWKVSPKRRGPRSYLLAIARVARYAHYDRFPRKTA